MRILEIEGSRTWVFRESKFWYHVKEISTWLTYHIRYSLIRRLALYNIYNILLICNKIQNFVSDLIDILDYKWWWEYWDKDLGDGRRVLARDILRWHLFTCPLIWAPWLPLDESISKFQPHFFHLGVELGWKICCMIRLAYET